MTSWTGQPPQQLRAEIRHPEIEDCVKPVDEPFLDGETTGANLRFRIVFGPLPY
jgi:hypothetical protein